MNSVLGIDAAWTRSNPSGVALVQKLNTVWRLVRVAASYPEFLENVGGSETKCHAPPEAGTLLKSSRRLLGAELDLVSIDMPLAYTPIVGRRVSDNSVFRLYGGRKCGTHSPSAVRPGEISDRLRKSFQEEGYELVTKGVPSRGLIECYPHPALVELMGAPERLPYKHGKIGKYWRELERTARKERLLATWAKIVAALDLVILGTADALDLPSISDTGVVFKSFEDALDSIVCAWVGICAIEGRATPYGDEVSAIWIPTSD